MNHVFDIGTYHCDGLNIGNGSYSRVFLGVNTLDNTKVAIKVVDMYQLTSRNPGNASKLKLRLDMEIKIAKECYHPNLIRLIEEFRQDDCVYLIFEYCSGGDLSDYLETKRKISEQETLEVLRQIISGMLYLQTKSILHRDLKPQNLLLKPIDDETNVFPYQIKIADFGFAKKIEPDALSATICGSPLYMAPELFHHEKYTCKIDSWSLGVIMYEMLVGKQPIPASSQYELFHNIQHHKIHIPKYLSEECRDLLMGLLRKKDKDRYTIQQANDHPFLNKSNCKEIVFTKKEPIVKSKTKCSCLNQVLNHKTPSPETKVVNLLRADKIMGWLYCVKIIEYILLEHEHQELNIRISGMIFCMQLLELTKNNIHYNIQENNVRMNKRVCSMLGFIFEKYNGFYTFVNQHQSKIDPADKAPNILDLLVEKIQEYQTYFSDTHVLEPEDYTKIKNSLALIDLIYSYVQDPDNILQEWKTFFMNKKKLLKKYKIQQTHSNSLSTIISS